MLQNEEGLPTTKEAWDLAIRRNIEQALEDDPEDAGCEVAGKVAGNVPTGQPAEFYRGLFVGVIGALALFGEHPLSPVLFREEGHTLLHISEAAARKYAELAPEEFATKKAA